LRGANERGDFAGGVEGHGANGAAFAVGHEAKSGSNGCFGSSAPSTMSSRPLPV
jgi:hypothetical protein